MKRIFYVIIISILFCAGNVFALTADLSPSSDTYVGFEWWNNPDTYMTEPKNDGINHSADYWNTVGYHGQYWNALMKFDLSSLPGGAVINSATLHLSIVGGTSTQSDPPPKFYLHEINNAWDENTVVYSDAGGATNNIYHAYIGPHPIYGTDSWLLSIHNNFYDATPFTSYQLPGGDIFSGDISFDLTTLAQDWFTAGTNNGIIFTPEQWFGSVFLASKEWGDPMYSPFLEIDYTSNVVPEPVSSVLFLLGSGVLMVRRLKRNPKN